MRTFSCNLKHPIQNFSGFRKHFQSSYTKFSFFKKSFHGFLSCSYHFLLLDKNQFWIHLLYFIAISLLGFSLLKLLEPENTITRPSNFDIFFMSVSGSTVSSMDTVEMELFSNSQLIVFTVLMLLGGEIFTSLLSLQLTRFKSKKLEIRLENQGTKEPNGDLLEIKEVKPTITDSEFQTQELKHKSIKILGFVILGFFLLVHLTGSALISLYFLLVSSSRTVLKTKGIQIITFSVFTTVSSFSNCGYLPTNENMLVFRTNSVLQLLIIPLILLGNTLFPPTLRSVLWVLKRITKREEFDYLLRNNRELGYDHLLSSVESVLLAVTAFGFIGIQLILFCILEWKSEILGGLGSSQKIIGGLFQSVNSRHAGESVVDFSLVSPALLVLYIFMMYLPPYTFYLPMYGEECFGSICKNQMRKKRGLMENLAFPQLAYLIIFIILICVTEQRKLLDDPLNFNVLNIVIEVISAYGNVGFSTGYSCHRLLKMSPEAYCKDAWTGFSGRWSKKGQALLILVMFFGRLKKFSMHGGKAWATR